MPKGIINPRWELAHDCAVEFGNEGMTIAFMKFFKKIEGAGENLDIALEVWRDLRLPKRLPDGTLNPDKISLEGELSWTPLTVLGGDSGGRIQKYKIAIMEGLPPIYETSWHSEYVLKHGKVLKSMGYVYPVENQPGRLTSEQLEKCGLKEKSQG